MIGEVYKHVWNGGSSTETAFNKCFSFMWGLPDRDKTHELKGQVVIPSSSFGIGLTVHPRYGDAAPFSFRFCVPPLGCYVGFGTPLLTRLADWLIRLERSDVHPNGKYPGSRRTEITIHNSTVWWHVWCDDDGWVSGRPKWRDSNFAPLDFFFGRQQHRVVSEEPARTVDVPMPEKSYRATITMQIEEWARPRLALFAKRIKRAHIEVPGGIPMPGKGENSYDCGDDATFGMTVPAFGVGDAVGKLVGSVLHDRHRRGGPWLWSKERETPPEGSPEPAAAAV